MKGNWLLAILKAIVRRGFIFVNFGDLDTSVKWGLTEFRVKRGACAVYEERGKPVVKWGECFGEQTVSATIPLSPKVKLRFPHEDYEITFNETLTRTMTEMGWFKSGDKYDLEVDETKLTIIRGETDGCLP